MLNNNPENRFFGDPISFDEQEEQSFDEAENEQNAQEQYNDESYSGDYDFEEDNEEIQFEHPRLPEPEYRYKNGIASFCFSQQGQSHISSGTECQDRCKTKIVKGTNIAITAIADGVGSCALSDFGADKAAESAVGYLDRELSLIKLNKNTVQLDNEIAGKILRGAMQFAYDEVSALSAQMEQMLFSFQSTLTIAIYDSKDLYFAHAGDDGIVALTRKGELMMVTSRHKGLEASSVYPLQSTQTWQFGKVENVAAVVMATDGVLDSFTSSAFENNRIYYPFIEKIFTSGISSENDIKALCSNYYKAMASDSYRKAVTDDLTIAAIIDENALKETDLPVFDKEQWDKETAEYARKRKEALYPGSQTRPEIKPEEPSAPITPVPQKKQESPAPDAREILSQTLTQNQNINKQKPAAAASVLRNTQYVVSETKIKCPNCRREQSPSPKCIFCKYPLNSKKVDELAHNSSGQQPKANNSSHKKNSGRVDELAHKQPVDTPGNSAGTPVRDPMRNVNGGASDKPKKKKPAQPQKSSSAEHNAPKRIRCPYCGEKQPPAKKCRECKKRLNTEKKDAAEEKSFFGKVYDFLFSDD